MVLLAAKVGPMFESSPGHPCGDSSLSKSDDDKQKSPSSNRLKVHFPSENIRKENILNGKKIRKFLKVPSGQIGSA